MDADLLKGFYLEDLLIEPAKGRISGPGGSEHLHSKAAEVLLCLASRPGDVVSRSDLLKCVWGKGKGSEEALTHAVSDLRRALHDQADDPSFIQTLPRRGYRLLVTPVSANGDTGTIVFGASDRTGTEALNLFESLNRRGVLETAVAYLVLGWLLIQVADIVFDQLHFPEWVATFVTVLVIAGFPIAVILSWFLELRDGRAVLDPVAPRDERRRRFGRTYLSVIGALAIASVGVFIYDQSVGLPESELAREIVETSLPPVLDNSIAVIPFLNVDGTEETQIIADGLAEDVISQLSRIPGLRVSSLGDSSTLDPNASSMQVRERLRVAMYLQGRVEGFDENLDVTVRLVDTESGFLILSRDFDQPIENFFEVRDEITQITVANVRAALPAGTQAITSIDGENPVLDAYMLYRRGLESLRQSSEGSVDEALQWFDAALDIDPDYAAAHAGKCTAYSFGYRATGNAELIELAETSCSRALQLNANLDIVYTALGELYLETGRYADAEDAYLTALDTSPSNVDALKGLGEIYTLSQEPEKAEEVLSRAVGLHPGDWRAYNALGTFFFSSGRYLEAARQYETVVALDSRNLVGYANLGTAYMLAADYASAAPAFEKAIEIEPRSSTYSNLGIMRYYLGDFDAAIEAHRQATELSPNNHLAWSNLGDALYVSGRAEESLQAFRRALAVAEPHMTVNPNDPGLLMDVAWVRAMLGDRNIAQSLIDRALSIAPDDPYAHFIDALINLNGNDVQASLESLRLAIKAGYSVDMLSSEPHLRPLRDKPQFQKLLVSNK